MSRKKGIAVLLSGSGRTLENFFAKIEAGDLVHIDFGITHHGYCTDQQQHAHLHHSLPGGGRLALLRGGRSGLLESHRARS